MRALKEANLRWVMHIQAKRHKCLKSLVTPVLRFLRWDFIHCHVPVSLCSLLKKMSPGVNFHQRLFSIKVKSQIPQQVPLIIYLIIYHTKPIHGIQSTAPTSKSHSSDTFSIFNTPPDFFLFLGHFSNGLHWHNDTWPSWKFPSYRIR